jgi:hypothetical protein
MIAVDAAHSKNPYKSISNRVLEMLQPSTLSLENKAIKCALRMSTEGIPGEVSSMEHTYPECKYC